MSRSRRTKYHSQGTERAYRFKRYAPFIHSSVASKLGHGMSATVYVQTSVDETFTVKKTVNLQKRCYFNGKGISVFQH